MVYLLSARACHPIAAFHTVCSLVFNDAATFDAASKTGGMDGSVILNNAERRRPEMEGLEDVIKRIGQAKKVIDAGNAELGSGPLSWADMMVLSAKVAVQAEWKSIKVSILTAALVLSRRHAIQGSQELGLPVQQ